MCSVWIDGLVNLVLVLFQALGGVQVFFSFSFLNRQTAATNR